MFFLDDRTFISTSLSSRRKEASSSVATYRGESKGHLSNCTEIHLGRLGEV